MELSTPERLASGSQYLFISQSRGEAQKLQVMVFDSKNCSVSKLAEIPTTYKVVYSASACQFVASDRFECVFAGSSIVKISFTMEYDSKGRPIKVNKTSADSELPFDNYQNLEVEQIVMSSPASDSASYFVVAGSRINGIQKDSASKKWPTGTLFHDASVVLFYATSGNSSTGFASGGLAYKDLWDISGQSLRGKTVSLEYNGANLCIRAKCFDITANPQVVFDSELPKQAAVGVRIIGQAGEQGLELRVAGDNTPDVPPSTDRSGTLKIIIITFLVVVALVGAGVALVYFRSRSTETLDPLQNDLTTTMVGPDNRSSLISMSKPNKKFAEDEAPL